MILVDIYVPSADKTYDFLLDENKKMSLIIEETARIISSKMNSSSDEQFSGFSLYAVEDQRILDSEATLFECGIDDGCRLLLV